MRQESGKIRPQWAKMKSEIFLSWCVLSITSSIILSVRMCFENLQTVNKNKIDKSHAHGFYMTNYNAWRSSHSKSCGSRISFRVLISFGVCSSQFNEALKKNLGLQTLQKSQQLSRSLKHCPRRSKTNLSIVLFVYLIEVCCQKVEYHLWLWSQSETWRLKHFLFLPNSTGNLSALQKREVNTSNIVQIWEM